MLTFEGKSTSFVAGKQAANKEPLYTAVGKKLLESLYSVHRERLLNVEKTVDDRLEVMDFLTDQSWKQVCFIPIVFIVTSLLILTFSTLCPSNRSLEGTKGSE